VIGFICVMKGEISGDADTLLSWINQAKQICTGTLFAPSDFLDDLIRAVPVFVKEGSVYRWSHKSLAEYFAAQYLCTEGKAQQQQILSGLLDSGQIHRFVNLLDILYDIDYTAFLQYLVQPMAKHFAAYWQSSYKGLDARIPADLVALRKSVAFARFYAFADFSALHGDFSQTLVRIRKSSVPDYQRVGSDIVKLDELPIIFRIMSRVGHAPEIVAAVGRTPYSVILDVLDAKKDPLIIDRVKVDVSRLPHTKGRYGKKFVAVVG
jgi:hypothetical protein